MLSFTISINLLIIIVSTNHQHFQIEMKQKPNKKHLRSLLPPPVDVKPDGRQNDDDDQEDWNDDCRRRSTSGRRDSPDFVLAVPPAVVDLAAAGRVVQADSAVLTLAHQWQGLGLFGGWKFKWSFLF